MKNEKKNNQSWKILGPNTLSNRKIPTSTANMAGDRT